MLTGYAKGSLDTFSIEMWSALKDGFMISTNDMNDFMMRVILGDGDIQSAN